ncbi:S41 family peptidase [Clostridium sp.]|uniref:S41 family peptidase n=1 Tax=Clostridium sp. TaxID=1506 RepID=UPI00283CABB1|nr:S41 family peptidase [Clostridium sp.]MDR3594359.1 S41 family peptidase [Clostridium sp.]
MKKSTIVIFLFVIIFMVTGCGTNKDKPSNSNMNNKQLTEKEKLDDFEYMYTILKENYPFFEVSERLNGIDWLSKKDDYISRIKATPNDESFFNTLNVILSELDNGHVAMVDKDNYLLLKSYYEKYYDCKKTWVEEVNKTKTVERYSSMKGKENSNISSGNSNYNIVRTMDMANGKVAYLYIHSFLDQYVDEDMKIVKSYFESIKNSKALIIDIRGNGGGTETFWIDMVQMLINKPMEYKFYMAFKGGEFSEQFLKDKYLFGNKVSDPIYDGLKPIVDIDKENLRNLPSELKSDFRYYYVSSYELEPQNSIGFNGKIYLLIDHNNFSATNQFANFCKDTGFATLIGEKTSVDGIGYEPEICSLPNSGYLFRFSNDMGLTLDGSCDFEHKTEPDINVPAQKTNNIADDQAIQTVLKLAD